MNIIEFGRDVFEKEICAMQIVKDNLGENFEKIVTHITQCKGKVIMTGMGKSGHVAAKIAASLSSLGVSSFFLHPAEAAHGDLGMVKKDDIVIAISYSGESNEITMILPSIKRIGAFVIGITSNGNSTLAKSCDIAEVMPKFEEACYLGLAPTSSTTTAMAYGDALAVAASRIMNFTKNNFGLFHPAGSLGKRLIYRNSDIMKRTNDNIVLALNSKIKDAVIALSSSGMGIIAVVDADKKLCGIITDGMIARLLESGIDVYNAEIEKYICQDVIYVNDDELAYDALVIMNKHKIKSLPVLKNERVIGVIKGENIIQEGIYL